MAPFSPFPRAHSRGKNCGGTPKTQVVYYSPSCAAPWTRPATLAGWCVGTNYRSLRCREERTFMNVPNAAQHGGGQIEQSRPGKERLFAASILSTSSSKNVSPALCESFFVLACEREQLSRASSRRASGKRSGA